jgi:hypothetical protein
MMKLGKAVSTALVAVGALALTTLGACSDSATSNDQATVTMQSQLTDNSTSLLKAAVGTSAVGVDSVTITRIRMFVRRLKLHRDGSDTTGDKDVKTEPFVVTFENQAKTFANLAIPVGTYDKVKFEFHRPETSQITEYLGVADFVDFVTNGRYSVIYEGSVYLNGADSALPFTYRSDMTANLSINLDPAVAFAEGTNTTIMMMVDPADVFTKSGELLDPRDPRNEDEIDNNIKASIKVHKK